MKSSHILAIACLLLLIIFHGCKQQPIVHDLKDRVHLIDSPAKTGSQEPYLATAPDGRLYMSWLEKGDNRHQVLRYSFLEGDSWSEPQTVAEGDDWIAYESDLPSLCFLDKQSVAANWIGQATHNYDINMALSTDAGATWGKSFSPHSDGTDTEHGFVSLLPWSNERFFAFWLDGRKHDQGYSGADKDETELRFASISPSGEFIEEKVLDTRACECCPTSATLTNSGAIIAYRDRSEGEIRDISVVRYVDKQWGQPYTVHHDGWQMEGCPVNGPAIASSGTDVAIAWYTAADDESSVKLSFSSDEGRTFGSPIRVDDGQPKGRVDVIMLPDGDAIVSWIEYDENSFEFRVRHVRADRTVSQALRILSTEKSNPEGIPQIQLNEKEIVFAWTESGREHKVIQVAKAKISDL